MTYIRHTLCICLALLVGCAEGPADRDLGPKDQLFRDTQSSVQSDQALLQTLSGEKPATADAPTVSPAAVYNLAELIDIAQQRNPATQQAWLAARRAGQNVKVVKSALLPLVTASVIAGAQQFDTDVDPVLLPPTTVSTDVSGAAAVVGITWLMFDFGENVSRQNAADQLARVAEQQFNRLHLQTIFDVSAHYHSLEAGLTKAKAAQSAYERAQQLLNAAQERQASGLGNNVEVAQAEQLLAQTKVVRSQVAGQVNASRVSLAVALNLPPTTPIRIRPTRGKMPSANSKTLDQYVRGAVQSHPEVLAALAQVKAAQFDLDAAAAAYLPKVYGGANLIAGDGSLRVNGFEPGGIGATSTNGVFLGVTIPLYDGELKASRLNDANDRLLSAKLGVNVAQSITSKEVGLAYEALRTSLAVFQAAEELVAASSRTAQAANKAYVAGIGTLSDASVAAIDEFIAREALADAKAAIYKSAAALALATGGV